MVSLYKHKIKYTIKIFIISFLVKQLYQEKYSSKFSTTKNLRYIKQLNPVTTHFVCITIHKQRMIIKLLSSHCQRLNQHTIEKCISYTMWNYFIKIYICYACGLELLQCRNLLCNHSFYSAQCADTIRKLKKQLILKLYVTPSHLKSRGSVVLQI